jgi:hypothetical protein
MFQLNFFRILDCYICTSAYVYGLFATCCPLSPTKNNMLFVCFCFKLLQYTNKIFTQTTYFLFVVLYTMFVCTYNKES